MAFISFRYLISRLQMPNVISSNEIRRKREREPAESVKERIGTKLLQDQKSSKDEEEKNNI